MGLSDIAKSKTSAKAEVVTPTEAPSLGEFALSVPTPATSALNAVIAAADSGSGPLFHTLTVTGGAAGGLFQPMKGMPQDVADALPQGRKPVEGIFLGYRTEITAWPKGFDDRTDDDRPCWSLAIGADNTPDMLLAEAACKQYQFTAKAGKSKFDFDASQVGHLRPTLCALLWQKDIKDIIVVQSTAAYESWVQGLKNLSRLSDPATGAIPQGPVAVRVASEKRKNASFEWLVHVFTFESTLTTAGGDTLKAFQAWRGTVSPEKVAQVKEWLTGGDRPVTDALRDTLRKASNIK